jgi:hypothetical protein
MILMVMKSISGLSKSIYIVCSSTEIDPNVRLKSLYLHRRDSAMPPQDRVYVTRVPIYVSLPPRQSPLHQML